jgi:prevent-host-death family protein
LSNLGYTEECIEENIMKSVALTEAKTRLSSLVDEVRSSGETIEIREQGEPAAYLVEAETFKRLRGIEDSARTAQLRRDLETPRYDLEDVLAKLGLDP